MVWDGWRDGQKFAVHDATAVVPDEWFSANTFPPDTMRHVTSPFAWPVAAVRPACLNPAGTSIDRFHGSFASDAVEAPSFPPANVEVGFGVEHAVAAAASKAMASIGRGKCTVIPR
jgi:hypothetical protein